MPKYVVGQDTGGSKIYSLAAEWNENFLRERRLPKIIKSNKVSIVNKKNPDKLFDEIVSEAESLIKEFGRENIARVGLGIAGPLDRNKILLNPPNLPFKNFPILERMKERLGLPVFVDNDASCFAWAEHLFGAAAAASSTVGITLGTGVGGGIILDCGDRPFLYGGRDGSAGEIGHMILDGERSFEELCSSRARHLFKGGDALSVERRAMAGDKKAQKIYNEFGFWLGVGIANAVNVLNPEMVVVGGSISRAWKLFEKDMRASSGRYILSPLAKKTKIVRAKLGDDAGALGAAYLL